MKKTKKAKAKPAPKTRLVITLDMEGDSDDAQEAADLALDAGVVQDVFNDHEGGPLRVTSALAHVEDIDGPQEAQEKPTLSAGPAPTFGDLRQAAKEALDLLSKQKNADGTSLRGSLSQESLWALQILSSLMLERRKGLSETQLWREAAP